MRERERERERESGREFVAMVLRESPSLEKLYGTKLQKELGIAKATRLWRNGSSETVSRKVTRSALVKSGPSKREHPMKKKSDLESNKRAALVSRPTLSMTSLPFCPSTACIGTTGLLSGFWTQILVDCLGIAVQLTLIGEGKEMTKVTKAAPWRGKEMSKLTKPPFLI